MLNSTEMNSDCREPRMGVGLIPLFTAATIFWMLVAALGAWIFG